MTALALKNEFLQQMNRLPLTQQCQVLQFARALEMSSPSGASGSSLLSFAGTIPADDLAAMSQAIQEGCEQVDHHEW
ncbi:hypothetical protein FY034_04945 [Trichlorobacter lovleyi]|uniref:hypothetical protein n=1 Tax=Trichlorobacter lovleyi TaxID=313985 RepID=UPI00223FAAA1|nr:hypothetical protein [Trichlorobacter lovleyi]QOX78305.1 hypothetical protein FY034_04945 [Trichlorobacter lovleyi]